MSDAENSVMGHVRGLLRRRQQPDADINRDSDLYADLELDSLEVAELSAALEEELGKDPYSEGIVPRTVGEVVDFYDK
jgi:acyl carrier protein